MSELKKQHWTERSTADFLYRIGADFVRHLETVMERREENRGALANRLGLSKGRISQLFNNPGNLTLRKSIEYARAFGLKVSLVPYDDGDTANARGPINAAIFTKCWEIAGKPTDFFALNSAALHYFVIHSAMPRSGANESYNMMRLQVTPHSVAGTPASAQLNDMNRPS